MLCCTGNPTAHTSTSTQVRRMITVTEKLCSAGFVSFTKKYRSIEYRPLEIAINDATRRRAWPGSGGGRGVQAAGPRLPPHPLLPAAAAHTPTTKPHAQSQDPDQGLCSTVSFSIYYGGCLALCYLKSGLEREFFSSYSTKSLTFRLLCYKQEVSLKFLGIYLHLYTHICQ